MHFHRRRDSSHATSKFFHSRRLLECLAAAEANRTKSARELYRLDVTRAPAHAFETATAAIASP